MEDPLERTQRAVIFLGFAIVVLFVIGHPVREQRIWLVGLVFALLVAHKIIERWQRSHPRLRVVTIGSPEKRSVS